MADLRVDMDLGTGANDGTSWVNGYQGKVGFASAVTAQTVGETIYAKDTVSSSASLTLTGPATLAALTNPVRCIGVVTGASDTILKADILLGRREGDSTKAYAQGGETPPTIVCTDVGDIIVNGSLYFYGFIFEAQDNLIFGQLDTTQHQIYEECKFVTGTLAADRLELGTTSSTQATHRFTFINCLFVCSAVALDLLGQLEADFFNCEFTGTEVGFIEGNNFSGRVNFYECDFNGINATLVDKSSFHGGTLEFHNCRMPANHILTTGTATGLYFIANYGSEDNTGLTTSGSEQALEIDTHQGTVDIETTVVRTGGATDLADGLFAYAVVANNVSDNFVGVEVPLRDIWVEGDGTAKTYKVHIANSTASTNFQDNHAYLRLSSPSGAGLSRYDYLPDEGAPGDKGGLTQLLGTPADLTDDTGSTWGSGGNNHQTLENSIVPDYEGVIHGTLIYSRVGSDTLYTDPLPVIT